VEERKTGGLTGSRIIFSIYSLDFDCVNARREIRRAQSGYNACKNISGRLIGLPGRQGNKAALDFLWADASHLRFNDQ
jgi:hypothetical protein